MRNFVKSILFVLALGGCNQSPLCYVMPVCDWDDGVPDVDGDGFQPPDDCDDNNPDVHPNVEDDDTDEDNNPPLVEEVVCDGLDNDCNGSLDEGRGEYFADEDGDGFGDPYLPLTYCDVFTGQKAGVDDSTDCDDANADVHPELVDLLDGVDDDCDGLIDEDAVIVEDLDGDGYGVDEDCNDTNALVNPDAEEICDGIDNDCDDLVDSDDTDVVDEIAWYVDVDQDGYGTGVSVTVCDEPVGYSPNKGDCNDANSDIHPGAEEWDCLDPTDYNCDGQTGYSDFDEDSFPACEECDDLNALVFPGAVELCNKLDDDCNNIVDDPGSVTGTSTFYMDADRDGYGDLNSPVTACELPVGASIDSTDCDDTKSLVRPGGIEICDLNKADEDCDGKANDADGSVTGKNTFFKDTDGDGYGGTSTIAACVVPNGYVALNGDCNDSNVGYHPGAAETSCTDPNDYNCDGVTGFADKDGDSSPACEDCNDNNSGIHIGAVELCNGVDDNCNGTIDGSSEAVDKNTYYLDGDGDGYGELSAATQLCSVTSGYVTNSADCDDSKAVVNPLAVETCNGFDDNCNSLADDADPGVTGRTTYYRDADGDTFGSSSTTKLGCVQPSGYVVSSTDCNDAVGAINPSAVEICDAKDNDCDGFVDDQDSSVTGLSTWYADTDGDGYGNLNASKIACSQPANYVVGSTDCDDTKNAVHLGATEVCNGIDDNCNGLADDADPGVTGRTLYYRDADGDSFGSPLTTKLGCIQPPGYVTSSTDCDDWASFVHPGVTETSKTASDDDCNGSYAHTDGVATFPVSGGVNTLKFVGGNLITNKCDITMGCGSLIGWHVYSYFLATTTPNMGPLAFTSTLASTRNAVYFDNTGGAAGIEDECRSYSFSAVAGNTYGITFDFANRSVADQLIRVYRLADYVAGRSTATPVYSSPYILAGTDRQVATLLTAGNSTEGFVLCAGGVTAANAVGFTEVWIGSVTVQ